MFIRDRPGGSSEATAGREAGAPADTSGSDPLSALFSAVDSGVTAGPAYAWALIAIVLVLVGASWFSYRQRHRG
jgi:hypothetical protein